MTGTVGSIQFHEALVEIANGFLTVDNHFIDNGPSRGTTPGLAVGAQFTRYRGPEGIDVQLMVSSFYDSDKYNKRAHPIYPNMPLNSARFTFLDFGSDRNYGSNIMRIKVKDTYRHGFLNGTVSPTGPVRGGSVSILKAGYDVFVEDTHGIVMIDSSRGGELIPDFDN
jgi:hypothetical protein